MFIIQWGCKSSQNKLGHEQDLEVHRGLTLALIVLKWHSRWSRGEAETKSMKVG